MQKSVRYPCYVFAPKYESNNLMTFVSKGKYSVARLSRPHFLVFIFHVASTDGMNRFWCITCLYLKDCRSNHPSRSNQLLC
mmetsp:Transcript_27871/g.55849  ORF Transcript_27871/g.55849 Transcript_27871/m.55849 type:complete len:81 (+) Transcript_27871:68-310(+)